MKLTERGTSLSNSSDLPLNENVDRERVKNARRDVAVALFRRQDGRVLLMRTQRLPGSWQPVGGGIKAGDPDPVNTVVREAGEELGMLVEAGDLSHVVDLPYDFGEGTIHCYVGHWEGETRDLTIDPNEVAEIAWFTLDEARQLQSFQATKTLLQMLEHESS